MSVRNDLPTKDIELSNDFQNVIKESSLSKIEKEKIYEVLKLNESSEILKEHVISEFPVLNFSVNFLEYAKIPVCCLVLNGQLVVVDDEQIHLFTLNDLNEWKEISTHSIKISSPKVCNFENNLFIYGTDQLIIFHIEDKKIVLRKTINFNSIDQIFPLECDKVLILSKMQKDVTRIKFYDWGKEELLKEVDLVHVQSVMNFSKYLFIGTSDGSDALKMFEIGSDKISGQAFPVLFESVRFLGNICDECIVTVSESNEKTSLKIWDGEFKFCKEINFRFDLFSHPNFVFKSNLVLISNDRVERNSIAITNVFQTNLILFSLGLTSNSIEELFKNTYSEKIEVLGFEYLFNRYLLLVGSKKIYLIDSEEDGKILYSYENEDLGKITTFTFDENILFVGFENGKLATIKFNLNAIEEVFKKRKLAEIDGGKSEVLMTQSDKV
ncbi:MAG: hypothetical protein L0207_01210 [Chlamydiae bacterium]|nr:hypothetical protein [Chlamydiota bacterium]